MLEPTYFDSNVYVDLCRVVFKFIDEHGVLPSKDSVLNKVRDYNNKGLIERLVDTVYSMDLSDVKSVENELKDFVQQQSWRLACFFLLRGASLNHSMTSKMEVGIEKNF